MREIEECIKNGNSSIDTKLNQILNNPNVRVSSGGNSDVMVSDNGNGSSITVESEHIKVVPDCFGYLKPLLTNKKFQQKFVNI